MSYSGQWEPKQLTTNYQISHGVVGKEKAVTCQECHVPNGRIDFGQMGYTSEEAAMLTTVSPEAAGPRQLDERGQLVGRKRGKAHDAIAVRSHGTSEDRWRPLPQQTTITNIKSSKNNF